jgi:succinate dehydrogenase assembly factor 2
MQVRRKRLIYRSKQRGWLEVDLLMGTWAVEHVPKLSEV